MRTRTTEAGIVLMVALIVMVAMSLAGVALVRAVDTSTIVGGNLALREAAMLGVDNGNERAIAALYEQNAIADRDHDLAAASYFASRQAGEDARGIPLVLQLLERYPRDAPVIDAGNGNIVRYAVERLCASAGPAGPSHCNLVPHYSAAALATATPPAPLTALRITIRVDGPRNTLLYGQMMLLDGTPPRRTSWRLLAD